MAENKTYSKDGVKKQQIDQKIAKQLNKPPNYRDMHDEAYLKALIEMCSKGASKVSANAGELQFFIVKGGAEGFLGENYADKEASRILTHYKARQVLWDDNGLLIAFDERGKLINAARLSRPLAITGDPETHWHERTANKVYDSWDGRPVAMYKNNSYENSYIGLYVDDEFRHLPKKKRVMLDMHKTMGTEGCISIVDEANNPPRNVNLNKWEPQFINDIQRETITIPFKKPIGTMHMLDVNNGE